jgi:hypothetical protein
MPTKRIILSLTINIILSLIFSILMQGVLLLTTFSKVTTSSGATMIRTSDQTGQITETTFVTPPETTEVVWSSLITIIVAFILFLIIILGVTKLSSKIVPLKDTEKDWDLISKITTTTIVFLVSAGTIIMTLILGWSHQPFIPLATKIFLASYGIIYLFIIGYSTLKSKERIKGIKKEEVFQ